MYTETARCIFLQKTEMFPEVKLEPPSDTVPIDFVTPDGPDAAGLYYLAELVEEYSVMAKYVISWIVVVTAVIHLGLILFENIPLQLNSLGLFQQFLHALLLRDFPVFRLTSVTFVSSVLNLILHHYLAFKFFGTTYYGFSEVLAYFTLCLWIVPFALFVSLSANDYVLPTTGERQHLLGENNVVTDYLSQKAKRYSLLSFFSFAKDSILPQRNKKSF
ncbi:protein TEX261 isoform X2 [Pieris napi]|uniref:protein TEX261 isoform X2 n=1 Tax=Pieris napi TaxID=78633 RepID=UPI001FB94FA1|nr:protein TEX261 isoform X2 [Pieris napi]